MSFTLKETIHLPDGATTVTEGGFGSVVDIIRELKQVSPIPNHFLYRLTKEFKTSVVIAGIQRDFEIVQERHLESLDS